MGLSASLQIGRSALLSYQAALQVVGNNISNAGNAGYTRQSTDLAALPPPYGGSTVPIGNGVTVAAIRRNISEAVEARLRQARSDQSSAQAEDSTLARLESVLNALGDSNLSTQMERFFKSIGDVQNSPENLSLRSIVLSNGTQLAQSIQQMRRDIVSTRDEANQEIAASVSRANQLASDIATLNVQITTQEAGSRGPASALRDQRDQALSELSTLMGITTREQPGGAVNLYVGNEPLVFAGQSRGLVSTQEPGANGLLNNTIQFGDNGQDVPVSTGKLGGLVAARDVHADGQLERLDQLASALISEVNKVHSRGQGLSGFSSVVAGNGASNPAAALNAAGLSLSPKSGTFYVNVKDTSTGAVVQTAIHIDLDGIGSDTTLNSLAGDINSNVANVTATVQADGTLKLTAASGFSFDFADDSSDTLAALGINTFFAGSNASNIGLSASVSGSPERIAASSSGLPGDGSNAGRLAAVVETGASSLDGLSLSAFHNASVGIHAVNSAAARNQVEASETILSSLTAQRESVSGVNLDEEAVKLVTYQRAYEGAARYITVVDEMLQTLLAMAS